MARTIDVYFTMMSPWAYLGHDPFLAIVSKHSLAVRWRPLPLNPLFEATGGTPLVKRAIERRRYRDVELARWASRRERPLNLRPKHWPFDPSLADRCVIALTGMGKNPAAFIRAGFRAAWAEDRDLSDRHAIAALVRAQGFDDELALAEADSEGAAFAYRANHEAALAAGVFGSPSYVLDGEVFWGQDRLDLLDDMLTSGRPAYRPLE